MVQEVVGQIVADITQDSTAVNGGGSIPIPKDDGVRKLPPGGCEDGEECGGHDEAEAVHGEIVVDAVEEEVRGDHEAVIRHFPVNLVSYYSLRTDAAEGDILIHVEQTPMEHILYQRPDRHSRREIRRTPPQRQPLTRRPRPIRNTRQPHGRHNPPRRLRQRLQEIPEQRRALSALVMSRLVHLLEIKVFTKPAVENLHEERARQVKELVLLVVLVDIRRHVKRLRCVHLCGFHLAGCPWGRGRERASVGGDVRGGEVADLVVFKDLVGCVGVEVGDFILEDGTDVFAGISDGVSVGG